MRSGQQRWLRVGVVAFAVAGVAFWLYAVYYLIANADPRGDGMELVAIVPLTVILGALTTPALILSVKDRRLPLALVLAGASLIGNYFLWQQLLFELAPG